MIELRSLSKTFNTRRVLDNLSLVLPPASTTLISGPSGSGKSTLLHLIAGLDRPTSGEILLHGHTASSPSRLTPPHLRQVALSFQEPVLWPHMTLSGNIRFACPSLQETDLAAALDALALTPLARAYPATLSGGEARRVCLARAVLSRRPILLLDEPFSHLDPSLEHRVAAWLHAESSTLTRIIVSHTLPPAPLQISARYTLRSGLLAAE